MTYNNADEPLQSRPSDTHTWLWRKASSSVHCMACGLVYSHKAFTKQPTGPGAHPTQERCPTR